MSTLSGAKNKKGFTLIELIITVGIIVVLCGVSIPGIFAINKQLEMMRADSIAREIYIASQNKLEQDKKSGVIDTLKNQDIPKFENYKPGDYGDNNNWRELGCISSTDAGASGKLQYVLPSSVYNQIPGDYVIEINPSTGDVYGVFYKEYKKGTQLASLYQPDQDSGLYINRDKTYRQDEYVGYYGGSDARKAYDDGFGTAISVSNGEELNVNVTLPRSATVTGNSLSLGLNDSVRVKIRLKDESGNRKTITASGSAISFTNSLPVKVNSDTTGRTSANADLTSITLNTVLDQIREDASQPNYAFNATGKTALGLVAGENIVANIDAAITYEGTLLTTTIQSSSHNVKFNSLYRSKITETDGGVNQQTIKIDTLRHLNNLRSDLVNDFVFNDIDSVNIAQTADIGFKDREVNLNPIENVTLFGGMAELNGGQALMTGIASFDGQGNELLNFNIAGTDPVNASATGLFSQTNCEIKNTRLVNPIVTGASDTGALVGHVYGGETSIIDRCGVYLRNNNAEKNTNYKVSLDIQNNHIVKVATGVSEAENIGGLIGRADSGTLIKNSFAAIGVKKDTIHEKIGGFIGNSSGTISNCYSSGYVREGTAAGSVYGSANTGGFAGTVSAGTIKNCYSTADVKTSGSTSGGFAGTVAGTIQDSISYGKLVGANSTSCVFGNRLTGGIFTNCKYLQYSNYNDTYTGTYSGVTATSSPATADNTETNTHRYNDLYFNSKIFPFPLISKLGGGGILSHYGDWPVNREEKEADIQLVYYEKYDNGEIRLYSEKMDTLYSQEDLDGNNTSANYVLQDGYAIISKYSDITKFRVKSTLLNNGANNTSSFATTENGYTVYKLPVKCQGTKGTTSPSNIYSQFRITKYQRSGGGGWDENQNKMDYYFCPSLAKAIEISNPVHSESRTMYVRTARQLNNIGRFDLFWNSANNGGFTALNYVQELDINFANYTKNYYNIYGYDVNSTSGTYRNQPIGVDGDTFRYTYDGGGYEIIDYKLSLNGSGTGYLGLFGMIEDAHIKNLHMYASTPNNTYSSSSGYIHRNYDTSSHSIAAGTIAGVSLDSTIENSSACGYTVAMEIPGSWTEDSPHNILAGGLVGANFGTIKNCSADNKRIGAYNVRFNTTSQNIYTDNVGLAGIAGYDNGRIENCYAGTSYNIDTGTNGQGEYSQKYLGGVSTELPISNPPEQSTPHLQTKNSYSFCENISTECIKYAVSPATENCYYLDGCLPSTGVIPGTTAVSYTELHNLASELNSGTTGNPFGKAVTTVKYNPILEVNYPFPAVVKNINGRIHYGDWPAGTIETRGTVGVLKVIKDGNEVSYSYKFRVYGDSRDSDTVQSEAPVGVTAPDVSGLDDGEYYYAFGVGLSGTWSWTNGAIKEDTDLPMTDITDYIPEDIADPVDITFTGATTTYSFNCPWEEPGQ